MHVHLPGFHFGYLFLTHSHFLDVSAERFSPREAVAVHSQGHGSNDMGRSFIFEPVLFFLVVLRRHQAENRIPFWMGPLRKETPKYLGVPSPFFPGILLSRKPPETQVENGSGCWKERCLKRMDKESNPRTMTLGYHRWVILLTPDLFNTLLNQTLADAARLCNVTFVFVFARHRSGGAA